MKIIWTDQAFERLAEIEEYVAADDPVAARRLIEELIERAEDLTRFSHLGRALPEMPAAQFRELVEGNYRIVYRVISKAVEVITVFESHRLLPEDDLPEE